MKPMVLMFFGHGINFTSVSEHLSKDSAIDQMVWFVLNNYSQVEKYAEYVLILYYVVLYSIFVMHIC
jgi:hypothetical protein